MRSRLRFICAAATLLPAAVWGAAPETSPAPGDEVMRPTRRCVRLTPAIARSLARAWMQTSPWDELGLTGDGAVRVRELVARRILETARARGAQLQPMLERAGELMILTQGKGYALDLDRELGPGLTPIMELGIELVEGVPEAVAGELTPEQQARLKEGLKQQREMLDRARQRLKLMAEGQHPKGQNPFEGLDEPDEESDPPEGPGRQARQAMREARKYSQFFLRHYTRGMEWPRVLQGAAAAFKFDSAQNAKGQALLAEYVRRAGVITTPAWKAGFRLIATWRCLRLGFLDEVPNLPWSNRLVRVLREAQKPFDELDRSFRQEVRDLATPEQKAALLSELRKLAEDNGMPASERPGEPMNLLLWGTESKHD